MTAARKPSAGHVTAQVRAAIQAECEEILLRGAWTRQAELQLAKRHGVSQTTIKRHRATVEAAWRKSMDKRDHRAERASWLERMRKVLAIAIHEGDLKTAERCLRTEARVLGLEAPHQVDLTVGPREDLTQLSDDDLRRIAYPGEEPRQIVDTTAEESTEP